MTLLNNYDVIPLAAADSRGEARTEGTNQEGNEDPEREVRRRFARGVGGLSSLQGDIPGLRDNVRDPLVGVGWTQTRPCRYHMDQIGLVRRRNIIPVSYTHLRAH